MLRTELDAVPTIETGRGTGVGFPAALQPVASQAITTDDAGLVAGEVTLDVGGFALPAYRAAPQPQRRQWGLSSEGVGRDPLAEALPGPVQGASWPCSIGKVARRIG